MIHPSADTPSHAAPRVDGNPALPDAGARKPYRPPILELLELSSKTRLGTGSETDGGTPGQGS